MTSVDSNFNFLSQSLNDGAYNEKSVNVGIAP